jgi:hypothetical protein
MPERVKRTTEHWFLLFVAGGGVLCLFVMALWLDPDPRGYGTHESLGFAPCLPMELWNVPCPGCGVTTSVTHAMHGQLLQSLLVQPFGFLLFIAAVVFIVWVVSGALRGKDLGPVFLRQNWKRWAISSALAMCAGWIYKLALTRGWLDLT